MTKQLLEEAPLLLAIIHLEFSPLPALRSAPHELQAQLHECLVSIGFAELIAIPINETSINFAPNEAMQSVDVTSHLTSQYVRYLFRAAGERSMVELTHQRLILRATDYVRFEDFRDLFERILKAVTPVIGLSNTLLKRVSLRYANLIVPTNGCTLDDFVEPFIRPAKLKMLEAEHRQGVNQVQGINQVIVATGANQQFDVKFEELPAIEGKVHRLLPEDLYELDPRAGLFIRTQDAWVKMTSPTYGILSMDHIHVYSQSPAFDITTIMGKLDGLYTDCKTVFWQTITSFAKERWNIIEK